jgi:hypothetical protein
VESKLGPLGTSATEWPIVPAPCDYDDGEAGGMKIGRGNGSARRKSAPSATLSTINPTWLDPVLNPGSRGGKPATNSLSYGAAFDGILSHSSLHSFKICSNALWPYEQVRDLQKVVSRCVTEPQSRMQFVSPHPTPARIHSTAVSWNKSIPLALILIESAMSLPFLQQEKPCLTLYKRRDKIIFGILILFLAWIELIYLRWHP